MIRKVLTSLVALSIIASAVISCEEEPLTPPVAEEELYSAAGNESFVENPIVNSNATRIWTTPEVPNADGPVKISFTAGKESPLRGYKGEVYAHIGILEYGTWKFVQAEWTENIEKCKFTPDAVDPNTWHLELKPSIREYFGSGSTPVTQIGIVIRNVDGSAKGIPEDRFITVVDDKFKPFEPGEYKNMSMPSGW